MNRFSLILTFLGFSFSFTLGAFEFSYIKHQVVDYSQMSRHEKSQLQKIKSLENILDGHYSIKLKLGIDKKELNQVVRLNYCNLSLRTYHPTLGFLSGDNFDLRKVFPFKTIKLFKGAHGIFFGLKSHLRKRSRLYFNTKSERRDVYKNFKKLSRLCKRKAYQKTLRNVKAFAKEKETPTQWVRSIPSEKGDNAGQVQTERFQNFMANLDGRMSLKERYRSLMNAKKSILIQTFIYRSDEAENSLRIYRPKEE